MHLWLCRLDTVADTDEFKRSVLSRYTATAPGDLRFSRGELGKPALAHPLAGLEFNVSDSGDWLALAVCGGAAVGIDIEYCDPGRRPMAVARRCFTATELADLEACPGEAQRLQRFYQYWTLKEAHVKARGGSLGRELEATGFGLAYPLAAGAVAAPGVITPPARAAAAWYCLLQPLAHYCLAVCCHAARDFRPGLALFELDAGGRASQRPVAPVAVSVAHGVCREAVGQ